MMLANLMNYFDFSGFAGGVSAFLLGLLNYFIIWFVFSAIWLGTGIGVECKLHLSETKAFRFQSCTLVILALISFVLSVLYHSGAISIVPFRLSC